MRTGSPRSRIVLPCCQAGGASVLDANAAALARNPLLVPADELLGFAARPAARNGDAERAVRTNAKDIAPRARHAHELDRRTVERRRAAGPGGAGCSTNWRNGRWSCTCHDDNPADASESEARRRSQSSLKQAPARTGASEAERWRGRERCELHAETEKCWQSLAVARGWTPEHQGGGPDQTRARPHNQREGPRIPSKEAEEQFT